MNIKEFTEWRTQCFLCNGTLQILPMISGVDATITLKDNFFHITSRYLKFSFHMETGELRRDEDVDVDAFLARREVELLMQCNGCLVSNNHYSYLGIYKANLNSNRMEMLDMMEKIIFDDVIVKQFPISKECVVDNLKVSLFEDDSPIVKKLRIDIPYIDLFQTSPAVLRNKIKTYIIFS